MGKRFYKADRPFLTKIPENTFYVWATNKDNPSKEDYELVHQESYEESYIRTTAFQLAINFAQKYKHAYITEGYDTDDFAKEDGRNNDTSTFHSGGRNSRRRWDLNSRNKYEQMYVNSAWYYYDPKDMKSSNYFDTVWTTEKGKLHDSKRRNTHVLDKQSFSRVRDMLDAIDKEDWNK